MVATRARLRHNPRFYLRGPLWVMWRRNSTNIFIIRFVVMRRLVGINMRKLSRLRIQEGWLATGNTNCMIGCTSTSVLYSQPNRNFRHLAAQNPALDGGDPDKKSSTRSQQTPTPAPNTTDSQTTRNQLNLNRSNFNQRGHKSDVSVNDLEEKIRVW